MNIDSIKNYPAVTQSKYKHKGNTMLEYDQKGAVLCNKKGNRGYYSDSLTSKENFGAVTFGSKLPNKISNTFADKINELCENHTAIGQNLWPLVLALSARPLAIMLTPGQDREDKAYAAGHGIASGVIGFAFSSALMFPLGKAAAKAKDEITALGQAFNVRDMLNLESIDDIKNHEGLQKVITNSDFSDLNEDHLKGLKTIFKLGEKENVIESLPKNKGFKNFSRLIKEGVHKIFSQKQIDNMKMMYLSSDYLKQHPEMKLEDIKPEHLKFDDIAQTKAFKNVTKIIDMGPDTLLFGVAKAALTIALIPPILKYVFGIEKKKKNPQPEQTVQQQVVDTTKMINKPNMSNFVGGLK